MWTPLMRNRHLTHRGGLSSNPTGATDVDPDDDATRWGAHPYDLYVRRGGIG